MNEKPTTWELVHCIAWVILAIVSVFGLGFFIGLDQ